jgi:multicomponent Na+:H+ antiporter subunit G
MVILAYIAIILGMGVMVFGILGTIIFPDILLRFHASTKCGVTGAVTIIIGLMLYNFQLEFVIKYILIIVFLYFTSPIVAHMLGFSYLKKVREGEEDDNS